MTTSSALYNNRFKSNYSYTISTHTTNSIVISMLIREIESWAFKHKIRIKIRAGHHDDRYSCDKVFVYFEDDIDLAALKLKFNV